VHFSSTIAARIRLNEQIGISDPKDCYTFCYTFGVLMGTKFHRAASRSNAVK
jgi:hypothetical protein